MIELARLGDSQLWRARDFVVLSSCVMLADLGDHHEAYELCAATMAVDSVDTGGLDESRTIAKNPLPAD